MDALTLGCMQNAKKSITNRKLHGESSHKFRDGYKISYQWVFIRLWCWVFIYQNNTMMEFRTQHSGIWSRKLSHIFFPLALLPVAGHKTSREFSGLLLNQAIIPSCERSPPYTQRKILSLPLKTKGHRHRRIWIKLAKCPIYNCCITPFVPNHTCAWP